MSDILNNSAYAVIIAGGKGERFWPQSRLARPKQLLRLLGNISLIEQTVERIHQQFPYERIFIITTEEYVAPIRSMLFSLPPENVISEPCGRDTGPCIAYAAAHIKTVAAEEDPVLCVFPSDHLIREEDIFDRIVADCTSMAVARQGIVTIGIKPTYACTGYGYIRTGERLPCNMPSEFFEAVSFREKPVKEVAEEYFASGEYLWNSGIFFFRHSVLINSFRTAMPALLDFYDQLENAIRKQDAAGIKQCYDDVQKVSFDVSVMEKVSSTVVAKGDFTWDDLGSWTSMKNLLVPDENGNAVLGLHTGIETSNCVVVGEADHLVATIGIKDLIVVHTDDATLICDAKSAQRVKELTQLLANKPDLESFL
ncbi:MAG: mannose-1-phosphate guanylyltransferase [Lentisphaeria bacterium]|nr:mannose-1-phosphate guanylyltransferase [Lentisphaeria bacterium]